MRPLTLTVDNYLTSESPLDSSGHVIAQFLRPLQRVWLYRWWEPISDGRRKRRVFTVGTVEQYKTEAHALKAAEGMRLMIDDGILRREPVLFCGILDRFLLDQKQEEEAEQITPHQC